MKVQDVFDVGVIMEMEDKDKKIKPLDGDDCVVTGKALNKNKIILRMLRESDKSEGNVFVKLNEQNQKDFPTSKKLLSSRKVVGMTLNQIKELDVEEL